jgi:hypothetical protein
MATRRWRQDPGLPSDKWNVEQRNGWFYATPKPKKAKPAAAAPKKNLPPLEFLGDPTLRGAYKKEPALNPNEWLSTQGRDGRYYAVKQTELTGLGPQYTAQVKDYDTTTTGQATRIGDAGNAQADAAAASAARDRQALADYARNTGVVINPSDPTAAAVARAMGQSNAAAGGPEVVRGLDLPAVLRASGASNVERYRAQRGTDRATMITAMRTGIAQEAADRQKAAADLRGQNLQLLASLSGQDASTQRALLSGQVQLAGQQAANNRAQLSSDTSVANTATREAGNDRRTAAKIEAARVQAAAKLKSAGFTPETRRTLASSALKMVQGVPITNPDGKKGVLKYNYQEVYDWLVAAGAPPAQAKQIAIGAGVRPPSALQSGSAGGSVNAGRSTGGAGGGGF